MKFDVSLLSETSSPADGDMGPLKVRFASHTPGHSVHMAYVNILGDTGTHFNGGSNGSLAYCSSDGTSCSSIHRMVAGDREGTARILLSAKNLPPIIFDVKITAGTPASHAQREAREQAAMEKQRIEQEKKDQNLSAAQREEQDRYDRAAAGNPDRSAEGGFIDPELRARMMSEGWEDSVRNAPNWTHTLRVSVASPQGEVGANLGRGIATVVNNSGAMAVSTFNITVRILGDTGTTFTGGGTEITVPYDTESRRAVLPDLIAGANPGVATLDFSTDRLKGSVKHFIVVKESAEQQALKAELEEQAKEQVAEEEKRIVDEKAEEKRVADEKAEEKRIADEKAEQERIAAEKAEEKRIADEKAEQERIAAEKAEEKRIADEKAARTVTQVQVLSGDKQSAVAGTDFAEPLKVKAVNNAGGVVEGAKVTFKITGDTGTSFPGGDKSMTGTVAADGTVTSLKLVAGDKPGTATIHITTDQGATATAELTVTAKKTDPTWENGQVHIGFTSTDPQRGNDVKLKVLRQGADTVELQAGKGGFFEPKTDGQAYQVVISETAWPGGDLIVPGSVYFTTDDQGRPVIDQDASQLPEGLTLDRVEGTNQFTFHWHGAK
ncbi:hypothetical protein [Streptomyces formicae]|uniref:hypothetical protein n=1 Tax=Streptomyces formicae TaxID=1616117 RepID=UPI0036152B9C